MDFYRSIAKRGDEVLSVHLGSKLSGTFSTVQLAAKELIGEIQVYPFDSGAGSAALAMMCREARLLDQAGGSINDILKKLEIIRERLRVVFTLDTLEFARMNGRVNAMQSVISSALHIKPIIILRDGLLQMADKVRTRQRAVEKIVDYARSQVGLKSVNIAVVHAADPQMAQWLMEKVRQVFATELSIPVAANLGPGAVGIIMYPVE
jgi:DegV family protein with EDD domain